MGLDLDQDDGLGIGGADFALEPVVKHGREDMRKELDKFKTET